MHKSFFHREGSKSDERREGREEGEGRGSVGSAARIAGGH